MTRLVTERLVLRAARPADAEDLFAVYGDPRVMRYWSTPPHADLEETRAHVARLVAASNPVTRYFVVERDGVAIGTAGVHAGDEIGFILHADHWRQGLMSEALAALIPYFFDGLGLPRLTADADPLNTASVATLKRAGFTQTGMARNTFCVNGVWSDSVYFALDRPGNGRGLEAAW